ncbi:hypothetical protein HSX11_09010 [Oxalobacteraceae bacterium]|nr:hypothetical protein [Oxalobacteraceae bacterium]
MNHVNKLALVLISILITGCGAKKPKFSFDIFELNKLVQIPIPMKSVQWEVVYLPEDDGLLPGPTDYVSLVAEFVPSTQNWFTQIKAPIQSTYVDPTFVRAWISAPFKSMVIANYVEVGKYPCSSFKTTFTKSGKPVEGFVCESGGRGFLYLALEDFTKGVEPSGDNSSVTPETPQNNVTPK